MLKKSFAFSSALLICLFLQQLMAQSPVINRTPEEQRELFGYCDKQVFVSTFNISSDIADKIGEIDFWATKQQMSIDSNTNEVYATKGELQEEVNKRYKGLRLSDDQIKSIAAYKQNNLQNGTPCPAILLSYNPAYDTLTQVRAFQLLKPKYRKLLMDKFVINGRQADLLFETEFWKQKESLVIAAIPASDFNRIRRTVSMNNQRDSRYKAAGLTDDQTNLAIQFFRENQLYAELIVNK